MIYNSVKVKFSGTFHQRLWNSVWATKKSRWTTGGPLIC